MTEVLQELDKCLQDHCSYVYSYYQDPCSEEEIGEYMKNMGIESEAYREFYSWKNGLDFDDSDNFPPEFCILYQGNFVSLEDALWHYKDNKEEKEWPQTLIVMMSNLIGEYLLFESDKKSPYYGAIFAYSSSGSSAGEPVIYFDSIEKMASTIVELYNSKVVGLDPDNGFIKTDFVKQKAIRTAMNLKFSHEKK